DEVDRELARLATLAERLAAPIAVAVPPGGLATLAAADAESVDRLTAALGTQDVALAMPTEPFDPSSVADAGLDEDFLARRRAGAALLDQLLPNVTVTSAAWPVTDRLTPGGAELLQRSGTDLFLVPFERYTTWDGSIPAFTDTSLLVSATVDDDSTVHLLVVDPITALLDDDGTNPVERAVHLMAVTSSTRFELGPDLRSFALTTPDLGIPDGDVLQALERFVAGHPEYDFTTPDLVEDATNSFFIDGIEFTVELDDRPTQFLDDRVLAVGGTQLAIEDVASMLPAADPRPERWRSQMRIALSTIVSDAAADERIETVTGELAEIRAAVQRPDPFAFTLAGSESSIPLRIENRGDTQLTVRVHAEAEQLTFPEGDVTAVLEPGATTDVSIPVTARSNGLFPVRVEIFTPAGNALFEPVSLTARVNSLTGIGRVVTVGAMLVLASWWFSYFRRRRRERLAAELTAALERHPAGNGDDDAGHRREADLATELSPDAAEAAIARDHGAGDVEPDEE
ncbi:MAG: DUF6049 family protein, partial [Acidimicrobiia bacterium]